MEPTNKQVNRTNWSEEGHKGFEVNGPNKRTQQMCHKKVIRETRSMESNKQTEQMGQKKVIKETIKETWSV